MPVVRTGGEEGVGVTALEYLAEGGEIYFGCMKLLSNKDAFQFF